jgi:hypothetical protein
MVFPHSSVDLIFGGSPVVPRYERRSPWLASGLPIVVDSLKTEPHEYAIWDAQLTGFGVRVRPSGAKSYVVGYRAGSGRASPKKRLTIGAVGKITPEQARTLAQGILGAVAHGRDPAKERRKADASAENTLQSIAEVTSCGRSMGGSGLLNDWYTQRWGRAKSTK